MGKSYKFELGGVWRLNGKPKGPNPDITPRPDNINKLAMMPTCLNIPCVRAAVKLYAEEEFKKMREIVNERL